MTASDVRIDVMIVDDSEVVRLGLKTLLCSEPALRFVCEAGNVATAITEAERCKPDVVLMDIRLPDGTGFDACREILKRAPESRVLILTSSDDETLVDESIRAGAHGYLLKEVDSRGLVRAIGDVHAGKSILDPAITARVMALLRSKGSEQRDVLDSLSPQERRVLALIAEGKTNKEVAVEMKLAEKTVKNYLATVFEKLHVTRRAQAAALYAQKESGGRK